MSNTQQINILQNEIGYIIIKILSLQKHIQIIQKEIKLNQLKISRKIIQKNNITNQLSLNQLQIHTIQLNIANCQFNIILSHINNDPDNFGKIYSEITGNKYNNLSEEEKQIQKLNLLKQLASLQNVNSIDDIVFTKPVDLFETIKKINESQKEIDIKKENFNLLNNQIQELKEEINELIQQNGKKELSLNICFERIDQLQSEINELNHKIENIMH
jgi:chromosome segregation ATPase